MTPKTAIKILIGLLGAIVLFHLCIVLQFIPYEITWGGRLKSLEEMYAFESVSIAINLFMIVVLAMKGGYLKAIVPIKIINIILWVFFALFALNTVGNIIAVTNFEKWFAVLTLACCGLLWVVLKKRPSSNL